MVNAAIGQLGGQPVLLNELEPGHTGLELPQHPARRPQRQHTERHRHRQDELFGKGIGDADPRLLVRGGGPTLRRPADVHAERHGHRAGEQAR